MEEEWEEGSGGGGGKSPYREYEEGKQVHAMNVCASPRNTQPRGKQVYFKWGGPAFTSSEGGYLSSMYMYIAFNHICTYIFMMKRLRNIFREWRKNGSHPGLNQRPLT